MFADPLFRVVSLAIGMLILGYLWYRFKHNEYLDSANEESDEDKLKQKAQNHGINVAVTFAVLYMVVILGLTAYI